MQVSYDWLRKRLASISKQLAVLIGLVVLPITMRLEKVARRNLLPPLLLLHRLRQSVLISERSASRSSSPSCIAQSLTWPKILSMPRMTTSSIGGCFPASRSSSQAEARRTGTTTFSAGTTACSLFRHCAPGYMKWLSNWERARFTGTAIRSGNCGCTTRMPTTQGL